MKLSIYLISILVLVFFAVLDIFIDGIALGNGARVFLGFATLWLLGTLIKTLWKKIDWSKFKEDDYSFEELK